MFSWYKYLIVCLVFSHLGFWSGNVFLIAPFPDLCLLVPFSSDMFYNKTLNLNNLTFCLWNQMDMGCNLFWTVNLVDALRIAPMFHKSLLACSSYVL